jgi:hypothetical protein
LKPGPSHDGRGFFVRPAGEGVPARREQAAGMRAHWVSVAAVAALLLPSAALADAVPPEILFSGKALATASSFRMSFDDKGTKGTADIVRPDSIHLVTSGHEFIRIGTDMYVKSGGSWQKLPPMPAGMMGHMSGGMVMGPSTPTAPTSDAHFSKLPDADDGGGAAHVWKVTHDNEKSTETWYVRIADGKTHRIDETSAAGSTTTLHVDSYNAVPPIKPPV